MWLPEDGGRPPKRVGEADIMFIHAFVKVVGFCDMKRGNGSTYLSPNDSDTA